MESCGDVHRRLPKHARVCPVLCSVCLSPQAIHRNYLRRSSPYTDLSGSLSGASRHRTFNTSRGPFVPSENRVYRSTLQMPVHVITGEAKTEYILLTTSFGGSRLGKAYRDDNTKTRSTRDAVVQKQVGCLIRCSSPYPLSTIRTDNVCRTWSFACRSRWLCHSPAYGQRLPGL